MRLKCSQARDDGIPLRTRGRPRSVYSLTNLQKKRIAGAIAENHHLAPDDTQYLIELWQQIESAFFDDSHHLRDVVLYRERVRRYLTD